MPFLTHRDELYVQRDGIAMGSPLGVLFSNFYMGTVEAGPSPTDFLPDSIAGTLMILSW